MAIPKTPNQLTDNQNSKAKLGAFYNSTFAIAWDIGMVMIIIAVVGIFNPNFLGLHLSYMHCFVLGSTGIISIWSGVLSRHKAFLTNLILGIFFLLNAVLGFLVGDRGQLKVGYGTSEDLIVKFAPGFLELMVMDHVFHLVLAVFFFIEAYSWRRKSLDFPANLDPTQDANDKKL
jgi:hypothetical protein